MSLNHPESNVKLPLVEFRGSPREIGLQHGAMLRERIHQTWEFYRSLFSQTDEELENLSNLYRQAITALSPRHTEEITAIAEGAELEPWKIFALNARTEIVRNQKTKECTAVYFRREHLLVQNWDWVETMEHLTVRARITNENGHTIFGIFEPGIIGKIGMNSAGLGVCLNILYCPEMRMGVPIHVVLRAMLDCRSYAEALSVAERAQTGTASNILIADSTGAGASIEFAGSEHRVLGERENVVIHTNHYCAFPYQVPDAKDYACTSKRYQRAVQLVEELPASVPAAKALLKDQFVREYPIGRPYRADSITGAKKGVRLGTVCSVIMELDKKAIHITGGNPFENEYEEHLVG